MIDIFLSDTGEFKTAEAVVFKAKNILSIQENSLEYEPDLGIDLKRFLNPDIKIQNETFEAYSVQRLAAQGVNVVSLLTDKEAFREVFNYTVVEAETGGLIV